MSSYQSQLVQSRRAHKVGSDQCTSCHFALSTPPSDAQHSPAADCPQTCQQQVDGPLAEPWLSSCALAISHHTVSHQDCPIDPVIKHIMHPFDCSGMQATPDRHNACVMSIENGTISTQVFSRTHTQGDWPLTGFTTKQPRVLSVKVLLCRMVHDSQTSAHVSEASPDLDDSMSLMAAGAHHMQAPNTHTGRS